MTAGDRRCVAHAGEVNENCRGWVNSPQECDYQPVATRYEVNVSFQIDVPDHLQLSQDEIEENVRMTIEDIGPIGFASLVDGSVEAGVYPKDADDE